MTDNEILDNLVRYGVVFVIVGWILAIWFLHPLAEFELFADGVALGMIGMGFFLIATFIHQTRLHTNTRDTP